MYVPKVNEIVNISKYRYEETYKNFKGVVRKLYQNSALIEILDGIPTKVVNQLNNLIVVSYRRLEKAIKFKKVDNKSAKSNNISTNTEKSSKLKLNLIKLINLGYSAVEIEEKLGLSKYFLYKYLDELHMKPYPTLRVKVVNMYNKKTEYYASRKLASERLGISKILTARSSFIKDNHKYSFGNWKLRNLVRTPSIKIHY